MRHSKSLLLLPAFFAGLLAGCASDDPEGPGKGDGEKVTIVSFTVDPSSIEAGDEVVLRWETRGAISVTITDDHGGAVAIGDDLSGTRSLRPALTTTYTLTAKGKSGEASRNATVEVEVGDAPQITFQAADPRIDIGGETTLSWTTTDATRIVLSAGAEVILESDDQLSGELKVSPIELTIYELEAIGPGGQVSASAQVEVAPRIDSFAHGATAPVAKGGDVVLSWETAGAETLVLSNLDGFESTIEAADRDAGSLTAPAGDSGTFRLVATRGGIEVSMEAKVSLLDAPTIRAFEVSPTAVTASAEAPATVTISWEVDGAETLSLTATPGGDIDISTKSRESGSIQFTVDATTSFELRAQNGAGSDVGSATVQAVLAPTVDTFTSAEPFVGAGDPLELAWTTSHAASVRIELAGVDISDEPLPPNGSLSHPIDAKAVFTLTAVNEAGAEAARLLVVDVSSPAIDSFTSDAEQLPPGATVTFSWTTRGATSVQLLDDDGAAACEAATPAERSAGSCEVVVPSAGGVFTYELQAINGSGITSEALEIIASAGPRIVSFEAAPSVIAPGGSVTLSWITTPDAASEAGVLELIDDQGGPAYDLGAADPLDGSVTLVLDDEGSYVFTLTASTAMGSVSNSVTVDVVESPTVEVFEATPAAYQPGDPSGVALSWETTHATTVSIFQLDAMGNPMGAAAFTSADPSVVAQGSYAVFPAAETSYRVVATNAAGVTAEADVTVSVLSGIFSFDASDLFVTAGSTVTLSWSTAGGTVALSPMLELPSAAAPLIDISSTSSPIDMQDCATGYPFDEGCIGLSFTNGFTFPFEGTDHTGVRAFVNGFASFDLGVFPGMTYDRFELPDLASSFVHIAPYWSDLFYHPTISAASGLYFEQRSSADGEQAILLWKEVVDAEMEYYGLYSDMNFELVMWDSGSFEFRYGIMLADPWYDLQPYADGLDATIGYQNTTGTAGHMLNPGQSEVAGGLSNRSWRVERNAPADGSIDVVVRQTTTYEICVTAAGGQSFCNQLTVTVN